MASVVFLRGVNVGGHKAFQPSTLARDLAALDVVNLGAAGTYVVRKTIGEAKLRAELLRRLPFEAELMICRGRDLVDLASGKAFAEAPSDKDTRRFVSVMAKTPRVLPRFPVSRPSGEEWQVKIIGVSGKFALSLWRRRGRTMLYPNAVVEKSLGVPATTRSWNTIVALRDIIEGR